MSPRGLNGASLSENSYKKALRNEHRQCWPNSQQWIFV